MIHGSKRKTRRKEKCIEINENENTTYKNFQDTAKVVLRGKFTELNTYIRIEEKSQINHLDPHLMKL